MIKKRLGFCFFFLTAILFFSGCGVTYPEATLHQSLRDLAKKEYGIDRIEIESVGTTLGVFLPLKQVFVSDFKEALMTGKVKDINALFEPTKEAMDKIEDLMFSVSRVIINTDKKVDFYYLQATDVEKTGMQIVLYGYKEDFKKLRFWDISRDEYRKRVIHEIQMNKAAVWDRAVRRFFEDLNTKSREEIQALYFSGNEGAKWTSDFSFVDPNGQFSPASQASWEILDLRCLPVHNNLIIVYAKVQARAKDSKNPKLSVKTTEYLFEVALADDAGVIKKIIPFSSMDTQTLGPDLSISKDLIRKSLAHWETEFRTPDIKLGVFLAKQLSRRLQMIMALDERINMTFPSARVAFRYEERPVPYYALDMNLFLKNPKDTIYSPQKGLHEDVLYLWTLAAKETAKVLHDYQFEDYHYLQFEVPKEMKAWRISKDDLERLRKKKVELGPTLTMAVADTMPSPPKTSPPSV